MHKLEKTFDGNISLGNGDGVFGPAEPKGGSKPEPKAPLDEIIEQINERCKGNFTDANRFMINALDDKLRGNTKLANMAVPLIRSSSHRASSRRLSAMPLKPTSYMGSQETYSFLFEDQCKYNAIIGTLAEVIYQEMRKSRM